MNSKNPYEQLDIDREASYEEIKAAYLKQASKHHPDKGGDIERFKLIKKSYEILCDPFRRSTFDKTGKTEDNRPPLHEQFFSVMAKCFESSDDPVRHAKMMIEKSIEHHENEHRMINVKVSQQEKRLERFLKRNKKESISRTIATEAAKKLISHMKAQAAESAENARINKELWTLVKELEAEGSAGSMSRGEFATYASAMFRPTF